MKLLSAAGVITCCILSTGCAYLGHRARDLSDIVTLAAETRKVSCVARVILPLGFSTAEGSGFGLREGYMGRYEYSENVCMTPIGGYCELDFTPANDYREKAYSLEIPGDRGGSGDNDEFWLQCLNVQVSIGLYYGVRAGLNLAEAVDFVLGWTTLDILKDDIKAPPYLRAKTDRFSDANQKSSTAASGVGPANPVPEDTARKLADPQH